MFVKFVVRTKLHFTKIKIVQKIQEIEKKDLYKYNIYFMYSNYDVYCYLFKRKKTLYYEC